MRRGRAGRPGSHGLLAGADDRHGRVDGDDAVVGEVLGATALVHQPANLGQALDGADQQFHLVVVVEALLLPEEGHAAVTARCEGLRQRLVVNETEAKLVRRIFDDFITMRSATLMAKAYGAEGVVTKGGKPFTKQTIYKMLHNRMYLGEIVHKGQSFPGQHEAIITQAQWGAVHALIATDGIERRRETNDRQREPVLLRSLLFTPDGERLVPSYTVKKGKTYRYYSPIKHRRFGAWASQHGPLPAAPIEELVTQQIVAALSAPHIVQSVLDRIRRARPDLSEPEVVLPMRNLAGLWQQLFPVEQCRLAQLLIERVVIADGGLEIIWRDQGWQELAGELMPGTIGAELQEWDQQEVEA